MKLKAYYCDFWPFSFSKRSFIILIHSKEIPIPELPEVETVRRGLEKILAENAVVTAVKSSGLQLRQAIPKQLEKKLAHNPITSIRRRAKYLLFHTANGVLLNHLGMTGSWRIETEKELKLHDHLQLQIGEAKYLVYRDPRRFGLVDWLAGENWQSDRRLIGLGPEPLEKEFSADYLFAQSRKRKTPLKTFIMDQKTVVGVGNIYAAEALFACGLRPQRSAEKLTRAQAQDLVREIKKVLQRAIRSGGTTISDFRQAGGSKGYFQMKLAVYGREGEACRNCESLIKNIRLGGRSSFYCSKCQS